jgi:hypothetical protein
MEPASLSAHFVSTRISQRTKRVRTGTSPLWRKKWPRISMRPRDYALPRSSQSAPWSRFRVKFARSLTRETYTASLLVCALLWLHLRESANEGVERCKGAREELEHWRQVTTLHKNYYFLPEKFVIPCSSAATTAIGVQDIPHTPKSTRVVISTPSTRTTVSSSSTSSPAKSSDDPSVRFFNSIRCPRMF